MKTRCMLIWSIMAIMTESYEMNPYRRFFMNYLQRPGTNNQVTNYLNNLVQWGQGGHENNHNVHYANRDYWTQGDGRKYLENLYKEYEKSQNENQHIYFPINSRVNVDPVDNQEGNKEIITVNTNDQSLDDFFKKLTSNDPSDPSKILDEEASSVTNNTECIHSATHVKGKQQCSKHLIFNEEFKNLRKHYWNVDQKIAGAPDYEFVAYVDRPETIGIINNAGLNVTPVLGENLFGPNIFTEGIDFGENCTAPHKSQECKIKPDAGFMAPPIASGQLNTKNKFSFRYGTVEIRAKLPSGDWIYPILYLNSVRELYGKKYASGQIRIAFTEGGAAKRNILKAGIVLGNSDKARNFGIRNISSTNSWSDSYHKYQLKWDTESITVSVDGTQYGVIEPPTGGFATLADELKIPNADDWKNGKILAPFDKEMYLQVGVGVGGFNFEDQIDGEKPWKNRERLQVKNFYQAKNKWINSWKDGETSLKIDYIKIWAL